MKNTKDKKKKPQGDNKFHLHIQTKYRVLIQENKKKPSRAKDKNNLKKMLDKENYQCYNIVEINKGNEV